MIKDEIVVSICCLTFNHVKYIRQCLDGILMQQCDFNYEVLIHDDASTDGTIDIIKEYQEKYPEIIKPIIQAENQYSKGVRAMNQKYNYPRAKGKYIGLCEGDDYWTDPLKLQKQVEILENNSQCVMCFHNAIVVYDDINKNSHAFNYLNKSQYVSPELIFNNWVIPTASIVFSKELFINYPEWSSKIYSGDYTLSLIALNYGKIYSINESMSVYRVTYSGTSASSLYKDRYTFVLREHIKLLNFYNSYSNFKFDRIILKRLNYLENEIKFIEINNKNILKAIFSQFYFVLSKVSFRLMSYFKRY